MEKKQNFLFLDSKKICLSPKRAFRRCKFSNPLFFLLSLHLTCRHGIAANFASMASSEFHNLALVSAVPTEYVISSKQIPCSRERWKNKQWGPQTEVTYAHEAMTLSEFEFDTPTLLAWGCL
ncbi:hypothetical protein VNO78_05698 [Psophocarpus tetragonolobus]|uniref:Uncharacterized protein n=1 Tax=Psophocarpus tetragonolobus TaxID=3891 RepID=A0AAN9T150_PSOTE